jgi:hypothetical protein
MEVGLRFAIREGGKTVGAGVVSKILVPVVAEKGKVVPAAGAKAAAAAPKPAKK